MFTCYSRAHLVRVVPQIFLLAVAEVVVTAQKRSQNLQAVPISITALSGNDVAAAHISGFDDLSRVAPGLAFDTSASVGTSNVSIRGVSSTAGAATVGQKGEQLTETAKLAAAGEAADLLRARLAEAEADNRRLRELHRQAIEASAARSHAVEASVAGMSASLEALAVDSRKADERNDQLCAYVAALEAKQGQEEHLHKLEQQLSSARLAEAEARAASLQAQAEETTRSVAASAARDAALSAQVAAILAAQDKHGASVASITGEIEARGRMLRESEAREVALQERTHKAEQGLLASLRSEKQQLDLRVAAQGQVACLTALCRAQQAQGRAALTLTRVAAPQVAGVVAVAEAVGTAAAAEAAATLDVAVDGDGSSARVPF